MNQFYTPGLIDNEYVMRGNAAILKCIIPSFVADFVHVVAWIDEEGTEIVTSSTDFSGSKVDSLNWGWKEILLPMSTNYYFNIFFKHFN